MKKTEFKQLIRECINEVMGEMDDQEPYDPETDQFGYAPRDRTEPSSGKEEHDYDEQEEIGIIKQIEELSSVWMKTLPPDKYVVYLESIYRASKKLLKMHGVQ